MADKKDFKDKKKSTDGPKLAGPIELLAILVFVFIVASFFGQRLSWLSQYLQTFFSTENSATSFLWAALPYLIIFSFGLSALFLIGIIYSLWRLTKIVKERNKTLNAPQATAQQEEVVNQKWIRVSDHINSENPNDWRLAILESDIILEELLDKMGYRGESIGDKLKTIEKSDFTTIDNAWEAHKIRNSIAHEGGDFLITQREARRVIELYASVFREFYFI
ncbi:MAG: hypothetical protein HQ402_02160 [Parcubacteria group bacterium]|nr:hypothetical protein [Parcubacteria group bacterium]